MQIFSTRTRSYVFCPKRSSVWVCFSMEMFALVLFFGCGAGVHSFSAKDAIPLRGAVHGGQQPVSGALIQMYAAGTTGKGSAATPLISQEVRTDDSGGFSISGLYTCPTPDSIVYLVAKGGNPGLGAGTNNPSIALMTALGPCGALNDSSFITVNEVTTVASIWPLAAYAESTAAIGFASGAVYQPVGTYINSLGNIGTGTAPGPMLTASELVPVAKIYTLANILAACVNSSGGTAGDSTPCGELFSYTTFGSAAPPTDTLAASIALAQNPTQNVGNIYDLLPATSPFQPSLASAPSDWTLPILSAPPAPALSPGSGSYAMGQPVSLADTTSGASIYYTTDGSMPSSSSTLYTGNVVLTDSMTVNAIAIADGLSSALSSATYTIPVSVTVTPGSVSLSPSQTQMFSATVTGTTSTAVTWSLSPAVGSISATGLYTAPATVASSQTVTVTATSVADPSKAASASVALAPPVTPHAVYYMSPTGSDSNNGTSRSSPWLTPNHTGLNCGDTITAAAGSYGPMTISSTPACATHSAVLVQCALFDTCKINQAVYSQGGILVQASYWAFLGWEVSAHSGQYAACYQATPSSSSSPIHDIYFINDIANYCMAGGFVAANGVDYFAVVADIAYNTANGSAYCYSGVSVYQPVATDGQAGTHIYVSQVFTWQNLEPPTCAGGRSTDGEGVIFDTFNGSQGGLPPYAQQAVIDNVLAVFNGAVGIYVGGSGNSSAPIYIRHSTAYGNFTNTNQNQSLCGQIASVGYPPTSAANANNYTSIYLNLAVPSGTTEPGCGSNPAYAYYFGNVNSTDQAYDNAGYSSSSNNVGSTASTTGFTAGANNVFGTNPGFPNPVEPPGPSCGTSTSVINCMATVIADFTPTNAALATYGYQVPSTTPVYDPLFPQWLCNLNLPVGLTTMGCLPGP